MKSTTGAYWYNFVSRTWHILTCILLYSILSSDFTSARAYLLGSNWYLQLPNWSNFHCFGEMCQIFPPPCYTVGLGLQKGLIVQCKVVSRSLRLDTLSHWHQQQNWQVCMIITVASVHHHTTECYPVNSSMFHTEEGGTGVSHFYYTRLGHTIYTCAVTQLQKAPEFTAEDLNFPSGHAPRLPKRCACQCIWSPHGVMYI